jgi:nitrite reductase (NADH) large subunit
LTDQGIYKKIVIENNQIVGCIMLGDTKNFTKITKMMSEKQDVSQIKEKLLSQ